jgi:hypothetical protein
MILVGRLNLLRNRSEMEVNFVLSEDKKKMYHYYGGKEKKAGEVKKQTEEV